MFVQDLAGVCGQITKMQKRRAMQLSDIINAASNIDKFHFIKESRLPALNPRKQEELDTKKEIQRIIEEDLNSQQVKEQIKPLGATANQVSKEDEEFEMIQT